MEDLDVNNVSPEEWEELYVNHNGWNNEGSGSGSLLSNNFGLVNYLTEIIYANNIRSIIDIGCGDLQWIPSLLEDINIEVTYTGLDCSKYVIDTNKRDYSNYNFIHKDIYNKKFRIDNTQYDLVLCKDVIQHRASADEILIKNLNKINSSMIIVVYPDWHQIDKNRWFNVHRFTHINSYIADENKNIILKRKVRGPWENLKRLFSRRVI